MDKRPFSRLIAFGVALGGLIVLSACQSSQPSSLPKALSSPSTTTTTALPVTTTSPTTVVAPTTTRPSTTTTSIVRGPTTTTTVATPGAPQIGSTGPAVLQVQQSLSGLGYWLGTPDGHFGGTTQQAVFALQKAAGLPPTGVVNDATAAALAAGVKPSAKSTSGYVIEVDLARDLLLVVNNGQVSDVLNTSTGGGYVYYDQGVRNVAITPQGHFTTYRIIDGQHMSSLGLLFRPRYFVGGYAIHGDSYVPAHPVSHGCVRVSDAAIDWIWSANVDPIGTAVWVY